MEQLLCVGLERIQGDAMMIVRDMTAQHAEEVIQGVVLGRVGGQVDHLQPTTMPPQQCGDLARLVRAVEARVVHKHDRSAASRPRPTHERLAQGAERHRLAPLPVAPENSALPPVDRREQMALAVLARGGDLPVVAPPHPATGQGGQQCQFGFILEVEIGPRRRAYFERLGARLVAAYCGSRRARCRTVHVGRRAT